MNPTHEQLLFMWGALEAILKHDNLWPTPEFKLQCIARWVADPAKEAERVRHLRTSLNSDWNNANG